MRTFEKLLLASTAICLASCAGAGAQTLTPDRYAASTEWPTYGHDAGAAGFNLPTLAGVICLSGEKRAAPASWP